MEYGKKVRIHIKQRAEWLRSLQNSLTSQTENVLREFYKAATIAHKKKRSLSVEEAYTKLVERSRLWSDEDVMKEIGERKSDDAEICLHEAIKEHAKILALSTATACRTPLDVPSIAKFFRGVLAQSAEELGDNGLAVLGTSDITQRKQVREWIGDIIVHKALELVPISKFAGRSAPTLLMADVAKPEVVAEEVKAVPQTQPMPDVPKEEEPVPMEEAPKKPEEIVVAHVEGEKKADDDDEEDEDEDDEEEEGEEK